MLSVSPLMNCTNGMEVFPSMEEKEFFMSDNLLDNIDFDDLFVRISDGESLPDLEMEPEILADFSSVAATNIGEEFFDKSEIEINNNNNSTSSRKDEAAASDLGSIATSSLFQEEKIARKKESGKAKKSSSHLKNAPAKKKVKVDWTPELHRRFVQAVEQLGVDKAVPSRILEIMGIDCLTRHNIASHLQKYRSHRKHLLAREAEAANWSQRRHIYNNTSTTTAGKRHVNPWIAPTIGFPPMPHQYRPLHVWGHPSSVDQSMVHMWPKHINQIAHSQHTWIPTQPLMQPDPAFWQFYHPHRCPTPHAVRSIQPQAIYKIGPSSHGQTVPKPPSDVYPSKESVDAAIGDALSKPWLPLPLGLKPPSIDGVMVELQRLGVSKVPPTSSCA